MMENKYFVAGSVFFAAILVGVITGLSVIIIAVFRNTAGDPLIGDDMYFLLYTVGALLVSVLMTLTVFNIFAREKIHWVY